MTRIIAAAENLEHVHESEHQPPNGHGWAVCACGATIRVSLGRPLGGWHACKLCSTEAP